MFPPGWFFARCRPSRLELCLRARGPACPEARPRSAAERWGLARPCLKQLLAEAGSDVRYFRNFCEIEAFLSDHAKGRDLVITMGAGDVYLVGENLLKV